MSEIQRELVNRRTAVRDATPSTNHAFVTIELNSPTQNNEEINSESIQHVTILVNTVY